jgi:hypothetical protein
MQIAEGTPGTADPFLTFGLGMDDWVQLLYADLRAESPRLSRRHGGNSSSRTAPSMVRSTPLKTDLLENNRFDMMRRAPLKTESNDHSAIKTALRVCPFCPQPRTVKLVGVDAVRHRRGPHGYSASPRCVRCRNSCRTTVDCQP